LIWLILSIGDSNPASLSVSVSLCRRVALFGGAEF